MKGEYGRDIPSPDDEWEKIPLDKSNDTFLSPAAPKARDGRYCNAVHPSVRLSVTFSFRTVTQKRIDVFSRNFAGTCTMSWGCAVLFLKLMECCLNFL